jgi:hypothetical protein
MRKGTALACALCALLLTAPAALATTQTASSGSVSASFAFKRHSGNYSHETLTIKRGGTVVYSKPVVYKPNCAELACAPASTSPKLPSVHVLDLEHNGDPDVVLDLYSGGAHCCYLEEVFSYDHARTTYVETNRNFGDPGAQIKDLGHNGHLEFLTKDDRFAARFIAYAASGLPIQILTFSGRRFHDVTRSYPKLIEKDAANWLRLYKRHMNEGLGVIAAWAADEYLLGMSSQAKTYLNQQATAGHLKAPGEPGGRKFVAALEKFLKHDGYLKK